MRKQIMTSKEKTFEQLQEAVVYIECLKAEIKKFPELYPDSKIIMEKIIIKSDTYEVLEGN